MATTRRVRNDQPDEFISRVDAERMAQEAAGRVLATMPDPEPPELAVMVEDDPDDIALANVIADLGGPGVDAKVNVYQLDGNRNRAFVRSFLPAEFSLEAIQSEYGPGDYEIHVRKDGKLATRKVMRVAAPKNPQPNSMQVLPPAVETGKIIETMQNGFKEMGAMFANALAGMAAIQPKPKTTREMLEEMTMMREIMGGNNQPQQQNDPLKVIELAASLAEKITPRTGEPGAGEIILEALKNFGPILSQAQQSRPALPMIPAHSGPVPDAPQIPVHNGPVPDAAQLQANPVPSENDEMSIAKRMYLNLLVSNAAANNDPTTYANLMLDVAGEVAALEFANAPDWFERLCAEEPRAAQHRPWFEELRGMVLELTKPENTGIDTPIDEQPGKPPTI